ncbi:hypothetical protein RHMOL_Rhmol11G0269900 [Rhododendron molle]|uniref:Uncharacterized protein n=3 Tax=Rhododendron molle TaxID=49168 RepID=A0ACC0LX69_RHOML|nr:hypothetical protein RHMOL_Rhmol11G0269900 [Rhododendron molle]KAI8533102.1 hypothetical protein RHMOL_Rhmol11G0269900 [Rhododendron molle]KAI8533103.1 hypothetical protein RHMOL_Rhmol11G0269900 [Rhododendron molle]
MAEIVVEPFVSFVVERLGNLLIQEHRFLHGVRAQVEQMQKELGRMQCFLKAADARRGEGDELVSNWISEIRELSLDAEDVIATFVIKVALRRRGRIHHMLKRYFCIFSESRARHTVGLEIENINKKITDLTRSLQTYGIQPTTALGESSTSRFERVLQLRRSYPHVVEEDIICLDEDVKAVVDHLVNETKNCRVVSILGMGGLGKTTLAKMVYNHIDVMHHFDCFAWAYISQQCKTREVLEEILIKLISPISREEREEIEKLKLDELSEKLHRVQSEKKCLVILDDIWEGEVWDRLRPGFPNTKTAVGSKILLTTRKREVAFYVDQQCYLHELRFLTEKESWKLFQKKACLREEEFRLSTEMTVLGKKMVKHCGGLPLAIVVLGGLLTTKRTLGEWENVSRNIDYLMKGKGQGGVPMKIVLELSYNDLPYHLKACFLCLSDLPEDEDIRPIKLIQRWMAEGFVSLPVGARVEEDETMLDVGLSYLDELRHRCMIQVGQLTRYSGRVKFYRLHDLVRDLCLLKAQKENFFKVVLMGEDSATASSTTIRRLGVYYKANRRRGHVKALRIDETCNLHHVRSCQFYFFGNRLGDSKWRHIKSIFKGFKLLTFLDLENTKFSGENKILPKAIGNLIHLRYLSIRGSEINGLPSCIGNLGFLETLDLRVRDLLTIPNVLWRLQELRHLYIAWISAECHGLRLDGLSNLETLEGFDTGKFDVRSFSTLTNLRKLGIDVKDAVKDLAVILESPSFSTSNRLLRYSSFIIRGSYQTREEQSILRQVLGYRHLHKLDLRGSVTELPLPDAFPPNLTHLSLFTSGLKEDPMPTLEKLPNLRSLAMNGEWTEMLCTAGGFPQLIHLDLSCMHGAGWRVERGAMPSLLYLRLNYRGREELKEIPDGLRFVTTLQMLEIWCASQELKDRLREGGEDFSKVQHVYSITFP